MRHELLLTPREAIFVFEAETEDGLRLLLNQLDLWTAATAWGELVAGPPRLADIAYAWERPEPYVRRRRRPLVARTSAAANPQRVCVRARIARRAAGSTLGPQPETKGRHDMRKLFEIGGIIAGLVLVVFGVAAIYMGVDGRSTVRDSIKQEQITFGAADDPAVAKFASQWAEEHVTTGTQARAFAQIIHEHAPEGSDGLTYSQMGRFVSADDPENPAGTSDEAAALKDEEGNPVANSTRNTWVTATALSTALNMSYMAEQMAMFGIVVGVALLLSGIGFIVLALGGARSPRAGAGFKKQQELPKTAATA